MALLHSVVYCSVCYTAGPESILIHGVSKPTDAGFMNLVTDGRCLKCDINLWSQGLISINLCHQRWYLIHGIMDGKKGCGGHCWRLQNVHQPTRPKPEISNRPGKISNQL